MSFVVPAFALLTVLALVPVAIHLLGKPRAERRPFAAMAFLVRSDRKTARRRKLRDWLLLAARVLAMGAIPLLLAKPFVELRSNLAIGMGATESAVIVIDDSRSMGYRLDGTTLLERARDEAHRILAGLGRSSEAAVLLTSRGASAPEPDLSSDRDQLLSSLKGITLSQRTGDSAAAVRRAATLLGAANHPSRRVYLISDLAAHGLGPLADLASAFPVGGPTLVPVDVAGGRPLPNRAVTSVRVDAAPELGPRGVRVSAEIASFDERAVTGVPVTLRVDGKAVARGLVDLPPHGRVVKRFFHAYAAPLDGKPAAHDGAIEIAGGDGLADDDRRSFHSDERHSVHVLLVDGDPRTQRRDDEIFYMETALHPGDLDDFQFDLHVAGPEEITRAAVEAADVVVLCNVKAPGTMQVGLLRALLARGGGLLLTLGNNVDPDAWNAALGDLLPQPLAGLRTVGGTREGRVDGEVSFAGGGAASGAGERVDRIDRKHPALEVFSARGADESLREARVARYALLRPGPDAAAGERRVLLALEGGAPLLVEKALAGGHVMLLTTTVDRDWSDLAIQPAFLPLVQRAVRYLAGSSTGEGDDAALVGAPRTIAVEDRENALVVTLPSGKPVRFDSERLVGRRSVELLATDEPGLYHVSSSTPRSPALERRPGRDFAVNLDPAESDLTRVDDKRLAALSHPTRAAASEEPPRRRVELWHVLGLVLLALLLVEGALGVRRS